MPYFDIDSNPTIKISSRLDFPFHFLCVSSCLLRVYRTCHYLFLTHAISSQSECLQLMFPYSLLYVVKVKTMRSQCFSHNFLILFFTIHRHFKRFTLGNYFRCIELNRVVQICSSERLLDIRKSI